MPVVTSPTNIHRSKIPASVVLPQRRIVAAGRVDTLPLIGKPVKELLYMRYSQA